MSSISIDRDLRLRHRSVLLMQSIMAVCVLVPLVSVANAADLDEANRLFQEQSWEAAVEAYSGALEEGIEDPQAWFQYGYALHRLGRDEEALEVYATAESQGAQNPRLFGTGAISAARLEQYDRAVALLRQAVDAGMPYSAIVSAPELEPLQKRPDFQAVLADAEVRSFPCRAHSESRQFDFWVGKWRVEANGQRVGTNTIEGRLEGCLIFEHYTTPGGYEGLSVNFYDPLEAGWRQIWIDNRGSVSLYEGEFANDRMTFLGTTSQKDGSETPMRMTFSSNPDGSVRQLIETGPGEDGGWTTAFDGHYIREE